MTGYRTLKLSAMSRFQVTDQVQFLVMGQGGWSQQTVPTNPSCSTKSAHEVEVFDLHAVEPEIELLVIDAGLGKVAVVPLLLLPQQG